MNTAAGGVSDNTRHDRPGPDGRAVWQVYTPLLGRPRQIHVYAAGTWGPPAADHLPAKGGQAWFSPPR